MRSCILQWSLKSKEHMKKLLLVCIFLFSDMGFSAEKLVISYDILGTLLEEKSVLIQSVKLEKDAAETRKGRLLSSFVPSLTAYGAQESFKEGNLDQKSQPFFGAELRMNIFRGGKDYLESDIREVNAQKKNYEYKRVFSEELHKLRSHYWEILFLQQQALLLKAALEVNSKNLNSAKQRIQNGVATETDLLEFEMNAVDLKRDHDETQLKLANETGDLRLMLDLESKVELVFEGAFSHDHDYESKLNHSLKDHEFLFREYELDAEKLELSSNKANRFWWPELDAFASYNQYNQREKNFVDATDRTESTVGLKMTLNLSEAVDSVKESSALLKEAMSADKLARLKKADIEAHIHKELAELNMLHTQVHEAEENVKRAEKYYKLTMSEYSRGVKNSPDVLGASQKLFETKLVSQKIIRDFQLAKSHVLSKIGR